VLVEIVAIDESRCEQGAEREGGEEDQASLPRERPSSYPGSRPSRRNPEPRSGFCREQEGTRGGISFDVEHLLADVVPLTPVAAAIWERMAR